jgi:hypothetical protein
MTNDGWAGFRESLVRRCKQHSPKLDSVLYNGGTAAVLLATAVATILPTPIDPEWLPKVLTGFAAFWIGLERALNFGGRWRYHRGMQASYENLIGKLDLHLAIRDGITPEEDKQWRDEMASEVALLQRREADIPAEGSTPQPPPA